MGLQAQLREYFSGKDLGVHLNGDEAMALGAAFRAANLSNSFRVRHVGMVDTATFPIGVRLVDLDVDAQSATKQMSENDEQKNDAHAASDKHWVKRASLFTETSRLGLRKSVSFLHATDVSCTFRYDKPSSLPRGVNSHIARFNVTGIAAFADRMAAKQLGSDPKVTLSFELDSNGLAKIVKAEATIDEEVEVDVEVKQPLKKNNDKKNNDTKNDADKKNDDIEEKNDDDKKNDAADKKNDVADKQFKKELRKTTHRATLTVVLAHETHDIDMNVLPMSITDKQTSMRVLEAMDFADSARKANLEAKNRLETFVYTTRDALAHHSDALAAVATSETIDDLVTKLDAVEDWLYDDGDKVDAATYNRKRSELDALLQAMLFRVAERKDFPVAVNAADEYAFSTRALMDEWTTAKPQVTANERSDVLEKVEDLEKWLVDAKAKQQAASAFEKPVVTSADVAKRVQSVKKLVATLSKKPKPAPAKVETTNATNENATNENSDKQDDKQDDDKNGKLEADDTAVDDEKTESVATEDDGDEIKFDHEEL